MTGLQHHHFLNVEQKIIDTFEAAFPKAATASQTCSTATKASDQNMVFSPNA